MLAVPNCRERVWKRAPDCASSSKVTIRPGVSHGLWIMIKSTISRIHIQEWTPWKTKKMWCQRSTLALHVELASCPYFCRVLAVKKPFTGPLSEVTLIIGWMPKRLPWSPFMIFPGFSKNDNSARVDPKEVKITLRGHYAQIVANTEMS